VKPAVFRPRFLIATGDNSGDSFAETEARVNDRSEYLEFCRGEVAEWLKAAVC
jgi:hypothetical protein